MRILSMIRGAPRRAALGGTAALLALLVAGPALAQGIADGAQPAPGSKPTDPSSIRVELGDQPAPGSKARPTGPVKLGSQPAGTNRR